MRLGPGGRTGQSGERGEPVHGADRRGDDPGASVPGQLANAGTRIPPSKTLPFQPRSGVLSAMTRFGAYRPPYSTRFFTSGTTRCRGRPASSVGRSTAAVPGGPPLSLVKTISVLSAQPGPIEGRDDAADGGVHVGDRRRIEPSRGFGDLALIALLPSLLLGQRRVRDAERQVEEERVLSAPRGLDLADGLIAEQVGRVARLLGETIVPVPGPVAVFVQVVDRVKLAVEVAVGRVEAVVTRADVGAEAQVPLADQGRPVAARLEDIGQRGRPGGQGQRASVGDRLEDAEPAGAAPVESTARVGEQVGQT